MSVVEPERPSERFRRTAAGTVVAAGLLGLRDALEGRPEQEETVMEAEAPGAPPPDGIELFLDADDPTRSIVVIHSVPPAADADAAPHFAAPAAVHSAASASAEVDDAGG